MLIKKLPKATTFDIHIRITLSKDDGWRTATCVSTLDRQNAKHSASGKPKQRDIKY